MLLDFYEKNSLPSHRDEIPCLLAFIAKHLNSTRKINEIMQKFGEEAFLMHPTPWILGVLAQLRIEPDWHRTAGSPVSVADIYQNIPSA